VKKVNKNSSASRENSSALLCIFSGQTAPSPRHYTRNAPITKIGFTKSGFVKFLFAKLHILNPVLRASGLPNPAVSNRVCEISLHEIPVSLICLHKTSVFPNPACKIHLYKNPICQIHPCQTAYCKKTAIRCCKNRVCQICLIQTGFAKSAFTKYRFLKFPFIKIGFS
jgi:hypothetical protein